MPADTSMEVCQGQKQEKDHQKLMNKLASDLKELLDPDSGDPVKECDGGVMGFTYVSEYDYNSIGGAP